MMLVWRRLTWFMLEGGGYSIALNFDLGFQETDADEQIMNGKRSCYRMNPWLRGGDLSGDLK